MPVLISSISQDVRRHSLILLAGAQAVKAFRRVNWQDLPAFETSVPKTRPCHSWALPHRKSHRFLKRSDYKQTEYNSGVCDTGKVRHYPNVRPWEHQIHQSRPARQNTTQLVHLLTGKDGRDGLLRNKIKLQNSP